MKGDPMTPKQAKAIIRSFRHRTKLAQTIPDLEAQLVAIVEAQGPCVIGGCRISLRSGELIIEPVPIVPANQLSFGFME